MALDTQVVADRGGDALARVPRSYSLPRWLHDWLKDSAESNGRNASYEAEQAILLYRRMQRADPVTQGQLEQLLRDHEKGGCA